MSSSDDFSTFSVRKEGIHLEAVFLRLLGVLPLVSLAAVLMEAAVSSLWSDGNGMITILFCGWGTSWFSRVDRRWFRVVTNPRSFDPAVDGVPSPLASLSRLLILGVLDVDANPNLTFRRDRLAPSILGRPRERVFGSSFLSALRDPMVEGRGTNNIVV